MTNKRSLAGTVDFKIDGLLRFQKSIGELKGSQIHVGVLGSKAGARADESGKTNAEIGAEHEYGVKTRWPNIPRRSFLEMPMVLKFGKFLQAQAVSLLEIMNASGAQGFLRGTAIIAEQTIDKAFETGGFGNWKPNSPVTIAMKKSAKPLIDLGFLRASIASRIVKVAG
jgi:phage gpG-like protein